MSEQTASEQTASEQTASEQTTFTLIPFEPLPQSSHLTIAGTLSRHKDMLSITYLMAGSLELIELPPLHASQARKDRLWEHTCFEFFLAPGLEKFDQTPYWEFNLSPAGDWNVFSLSGYRTGLKEESAFSELPFSVSYRIDNGIDNVRGKANGLQLTLSVDIGKLLPAGVPWRLGVSTVGRLRDGSETFWAIAHPTANADFHSSGSFAVQLL